MRHGGPASPAQGRTPLIAGGVVRWWARNRGCPVNRCSSWNGPAFVCVCSLLFMEHVLHARPINSSCTFSSSRSPYRVDITPLEQTGQQDSVCRPSCKVGICWEPGPGAVWLQREAGTGREERGIKSQTRSPGGGNRKDSSNQPTVLPSWRRSCCFTVWGGQHHSTQMHSTGVRSPTSRRQTPWTTSAKDNIHGTHTPSPCAFMSLHDACVL